MTTPKTDPIIGILHSLIQEYKFYKKLFDNCEDYERCKMAKYKGESLFDAIVNAIVENSDKLDANHPLNRILEEEYEKYSNNRENRTDEYGKELEEQEIREEFTGCIDCLEKILNRIENLYHGKEQY